VLKVPLNSNHSIILIADGDDDVAVVHSYDYEFQLLNSFLTAKHLWSFTLKKLCAAW